MSTKAKIKVQLTLTVEFGQTWDDGCSLAQVRMQALQQANEMVRHALGDEPRVRIGPMTEIEVTLTGEP